MMGTAVKSFIKMAMVVAATVLVMLVVNSVNSMDAAKSKDRYVTRLDRVSIALDGENGRISFYDIAEHRDEKTKAVQWLASFTYNGDESIIGFECIDFNREQKYKPTFAFVENVKTNVTYDDYEKLGFDKSYVERFVLKMCEVSKIIHL